MKSDLNKKISKLMSYALRHHPAHLELELDAEGWVATTDLIAGLRQQVPTIDLPLLKEVVETNDKQRFTFNTDQTKIRANQGHSIEVELQLTPKEPPQLLYHGTVAKFLPTIEKDGLKKMSRQHVHLSPDIPTAKNVGTRRGHPIILTILAAQMHQDGIPFYESKNGVWLVDHVPSNYLSYE